MFKCWTVFDLDQDKVVAFWYGDSAPSAWKRKYNDSTRFVVSWEYQGVGQRAPRAE